MMKSLVIYRLNDEPPNANSPNPTTLRKVPRIMVRKHHLSLSLVTAQAVDVK